MSDVLRYERSAVIGVGGLLKLIRDESATSPDHSQVFQIFRLESESPTHSRHTELIMAPILRLAARAIPRRLCDFVTL